MSYDLSVYSPRADVIRKEELKAYLKAQHWEIVYLPDDAFLSTQSETLFADAGTIEKHTLIAGWPDDAGNAANLKDLFQRGEMKRLAQLFEDSNAFFTCPVSVTAPYDFFAGRSGDNNEDYRQQLVEALGADCAKVMMEAQVLYDISGRAMQMVVSGDFILAVWEAIGVLCDGLLEDPQDGDYRLARPS